ncbi:MAG: hydantoinase/oxoprolinase family protein [Acetobacteraceae bacterium]|nr:hydantoinase/oxoprolinase family protein [Acetobacteraceae bacterium]
MAWRIGVDIGGTFIDFCAMEESEGTLHTLKVLTTPDEPGRELADGLSLLRERHGLDEAQVESFVHGTTVGINTIIQRKGAALALLTNAGFEDVVELARLRMPDTYSLFCARAEPLIPRDRIFGVACRILADGTEGEALDEAAVAAAARAAEKAGADGIIVSFLHAYRNPAHEREAAAIIRATTPGLFVFTAADIWPVIREYERTTTGILNGYVHPRVDRYLSALEATLARHSVPAAPMITKSNGGIMSCALGKQACVSMLLSGTASGVMGASFLARQAGISRALTLDIGGTSADVALVIDGEAQFGTGEMIGEFPLYVPSVSVSSIGDGGGSIAWVDGFGMLKVGPESAGSTPGPACYGRGGTRATITDAMAVLGWLGHAPLAYSAIRMDRALAEAAVGEVARQLGRSLNETAEAIIDVAVSGMFAEVNKLVARFGVDARDFTLVPFGGAGPMLGVQLARELGITRVMVPRRPGLVSALGGLIADVKNDFVRTLFVDLGEPELPTLRAARAALAEDADAWLRAGQGFKGEATLSYSADMRYHGQSFEIEVPIEAAWIDAGELGTLRGAFDRRHTELYDFADDAAPIQLVNLRAVVTGHTVAPTFAREPRREGAPKPERLVEVWHNGGPVRMPLYPRGALHHGQHFRGPAIVAQEDTTLCIPEGYDAEVDEFGNLHLSAEEIA